MKLYQLPFSPSCQKVLALAHEVGTSLELVTIDIFKGEAKTPAILAKNPNGKIPILEDGDLVLWESAAMLAYIAAKAGRTDLAPTTPRERAEVDRWTAWEGAHFGPAIRKVAFQRIVKKIAGLGAPDEALVQIGVDEFTASAKVLEQSLGSKEYLCGRLTVADFDVAPYAALAESCGLDLAAYPKTAAWLARMLARDSMKATMAAASGAALKPFEALVEPHRALLRLHCYRMLGSSHDSDDMVQETLVRAFRAQDTLHDPASARAWLHRIATNVCLDELARRPRRARGARARAARRPGSSGGAADSGPEWLEPVPSSWLQVPAPEGADPAAQYTLKESVALAFVAALQVLTPSQRAVLLLRDVVGLSAAETAEALACSVPSANSALHRARVTLEERVGPRASWSPEVGAVDRALLERYVRAWEKGDLDAIIALLHEEVTLAMPPSPTWLAGRAGRRSLLHEAPAARGPRGSLPHVARGGEREPRRRFYRLGDDGQGPFLALQALELKDGRIRVIDHFASASSHEAFFAEGLARTIAAG